MASCNFDKITNSGESIGIDGINIKAGKEDLIKDGKISLKAGNRYGVVGRNGSGKTSLLNGILGELKKNPCFSAMGIEQFFVKGTWEGINIVTLVLRSNEERFRLIQEYEKLEKEIEEIEDEEELKELLDKMTELQGQDVDKDESLVRKVLHGLGFSEEDMKKDYYSFSGGWKTRISLARALYMKPSVLFLDEPTNHLDLEAVYWLENYLQKYSGILVFISHNIDFLNTVSTDIFHIFNKSIRHYQGDYNRFQTQFISDLEQLEKNYNLHQKKIKTMRAKGNTKEVDKLMKLDVPRPEKPVKIKMKFEADVKAKSPYITMSDVTFGYTEDKILIANLDLCLLENTRATIVGMNGCGKSTLFKLLLGDIQPLSGEIKRNDNVKVSYFSQHSIEELPQELTPVEYLTEKYGLDTHNVRKMLGTISLANEYHNKPISILSGGQRMRIVFSEVVIEKPHIILLDEPTNHLDIETIECLIESIKDYNGCVIVISHDLFLIESTECEILHLTETHLNKLESIDDYIELLDDEEK